MCGVEVLHHQARRPRCTGAAKIGGRARAPRMRAKIKRDIEWQRGRATKEGGVGQPGRSRPRRGGARQRGRTKKGGGWYGNGTVHDQAGRERGNRAARRKGGGCAAIGPHTNRRSGRTRPGGLSDAATGPRKEAGGGWVTTEPYTTKRGGEHRGYVKKMRVSGRSRGRTL